MNKDKLIDYFDTMSPSENQKERMKRDIIAHQQVPAKVMKKGRNRKRTTVSIGTIGFSLAIILLLSFLNPFGGNDITYGINFIHSNGTSIKMEDYRDSYENYENGFSTSVSKIESRPDLEFYIEGENIAKIEMESENEYLYAVDWTETQHEKFWNTEYFQDFDEEKQISIFYPEKLYDKKLTMEFDKDFTEYDQIWYRWFAWDLYEWAAENDFAQFTPQGHIDITGYPEDLLKDTITITITNRNGEVTTQEINIEISNEVHNELLRTIVTASLSTE
ncbi:hypothetical protein GGQ92_002265 [Gracilibacillus halotolerans]|uniref:Uncharacterized protein n=1 Tax=Gracilibacillus halotolerans TaxID=74386 RepID=A0A841RPA3_9BACI|nr:hypothetical protein [Gracilibacillus halotolerans]MBB6513453.1 hypothetical protein [Gracilibacillus halotolerans]